MAEKIWVERAYVEEDFSSGLSPLLNKILAKRKLQSTTHEFLESSLKNLKEPYTFADMEKAVSLIGDAISSDEVIGIFGDYDVDGVCSTAILEQFFTSVGVKAVTTLPNRMLEGYGLSKAGVDRLHHQGANILITVDCGITAHEQIDYANSLGLKVIVVDHHTVGETLPNACAVINPKRSDCSSKADYLCAAGVAFFLCIALRRYLREVDFFLSHPEPDIRELLDLVALATVCDVVPLVLDNRALVKAGLKVLKQGGRTGLLALMDACGIDKQKISSTNLGFHLGPRINAAGRLEDASLALTLMNCQDFIKAKNIAEELNLTNQERKSIEENTVKEACSIIDTMPDELAIVLHNEDWHPGVVGIVASRIAEKYHRPSIIIGEKGKGSGRSIKGVDLHALVQKASKSLSGFGGHAHAIGLTLGQGVETFYDDLRRAMADVPKTVFAQQIFYDTEVLLKDLSLEVVDELSKLEPFGAANPSPVLRLNKVHMRNLKKLSGGHLKGELETKEGAISFIGFRMDVDDDMANSTLDVLGVVEKNEWLGRISLQFRIIDFKAA